MKIGDYVRTKSGEITKITKVSINEVLNEVNTENEVYTEYWKRKANCLHIGTDWKTSPNIIDLIEVGDYVNGHRVIDFILENGKRKGIIVDADIWGFDIDEIKSIVTKEQFESMEYKL